MFRELGKTPVENDSRMSAQTFDSIAKAHLRRAKKQPDNVRKILQTIKDGHNRHGLQTSRPYNAALGVLEVSHELASFAQSFAETLRLDQGIYLMEASFGIRAAVSVLASSEDLLKGLKDTYLNVIPMPEAFKGPTRIPFLSDYVIKLYLEKTEERRKQLFEQDETGIKVMADFASFARGSISPGFSAGVEFAENYYKALYPLTASDAGKPTQGKSPAKKSSTHRFWKI